MSLEDGICQIYSLDEKKPVYGTFGTDYIESGSFTFDENWKLAGILYAF